MIKKSINKYIKTYQELSQPTNSLKMARIFLNNITYFHINI